MNDLMKCSQQQDQHISLQEREFLAYLSLTFKNGIIEKNEKNIMRTNQL